MRVRIKICGLHEECALEAACAAGVDAVGFVLAPSARQVSLARARALLRLVPPGIERVAVFARATRPELVGALTLEIDALEAELGSEWPHFRADTFALPVLRDGQELELHAQLLALAAPRPDSLRGALVLDGPQGGGRGRPVDAARAQRLAATRRVVLSGGLTPANVAARIRAVQPFAVNVSSGVERVRGRKDPALIQAFVRAVRALEQEPSESSA